MKTQAWKPAASTSSDAPKEGLYLDELVQFYEPNTRVTSEIPAAAAFVMAIEFVSRNIPFEIRDTASQEVWMSSNGKNAEGSHSMMQAMADTAVMLDGIVRRHLKEFASQIQNSIQQASRERALALAAPPMAPAEPVSEAPNSEAARNAEPVSAEVPANTVEPGAVIADSAAGTA